MKSVTKTKELRGQVRWKFWGILKEGKVIKQDPYFPAYYEARFFIKIGNSMSEQQTY